MCVCVCCISMIGRKKGREREGELRLAPQSFGLLCSAAFALAHRWPAWKHLVEKLENQSPHSIFTREKKGSIFLIAKKLLQKSTIRFKSNRSKPFGQVGKKH